MKIGMLTSGGDCQSLNAAMRGVAKTLYNNTNDVEIYGFLDGYKGMITKNYKLMKEEDFSGILTEGGTILELPEHLSNISMSLMRKGAIRLQA